MYSEVDLRQSLPLLGPAGPLTGVRLTGDGFGLGVHGGITFELSDNQRCAATVRSPIKIEYEGDTDVNGFTGPLATRSDFDSEIEFPTMVGLGYGVEFDNGLRVGIDVEWIEFSTFDEFPVDVGVNGAVGLFPPSIPQDWDDTWTFGIGGDMPISEEWILRAGYIHMETPIPEATMAPTLPDDDRNVFSIGLGHTGENHTLDIAYAINVFERKIDSSPIPAFNGEYELTGQMVQVSYRRAL
jgi:long-chain fatty acid transport protein